MAFDAQGKWTPEDDSVSNRVTGLLAKDSPLLQQARASAAQGANRRGLLNSSMAVQAGETAALSSVLPIASQEAQQTHQKNLTAMDMGSKERIAAENVAAHDRQYAMSAIASANQNYESAFMNVAKEYNLPESARNSYTAHLGRLRDSDLNLIEQMYGVDLVWGSTDGGLTPGTPSDQPLIT